MLSVLFEGVDYIYTNYLGWVLSRNFERGRFAGSETVWEEVGRLPEKGAKRTREFDIKSPSVLLDGAILILKIMDFFRETAGKHP